VLLFNLLIMKKQSLQKGFTLIELLVVVAIIGLLAATILASLGTARARARSARVQSEVSSMRAAAELVFASSGSYANVFTDTTSGMDKLVSDAIGSNTLNDGQSNAAETDGSSWAFAVVLPDGSGNYCADSNGFSGRATLAIGTGPYACTQ
jgi:prepilin-type N-terminal cleavage/methylation domain-containing protein